MRALLVDDERLALQQLEMMLCKIEGITVVGAYTEPAQALAAAPGLRPDVAFLDIEMPEMNGIQAAERLQERCPGTEIVFVTAYDEYAVRAFEVNALDYVLKPVLRGRLEKTVERLQQRAEQAKDSTRRTPGDVMRICCLPSLQIERPGQQPEPLKWRTAKAQELFAYLLCQRGQVVRKSALIELLWPESDARKGATLLYTTIYQVRQCLKRAGLDVAIQSLSAEDGYWLQLEPVKLDVDEWEKGLAAAGPVSRQTIAAHERLVAMYRGDYLADSDYWWAESERQRLRQLWLKRAQQLAEFYEREQQPDEAIRLYRGMLRLDPLLEDVSFALMKLYAQLGQRTAVEEQYRELTAAVDRELAIVPYRHIVEWYDRWKTDARHK